MRDSYCDVTDGIDKQVLTLKGEIRQLGSFVNHLSSFEPLLNNINGIGVEILDNYCSSIAKQAIKHIQVVRNTIDNMIPLIEGNDELLYILEECKLAILYNELDIYIQLSDCEDWISRINHALFLIETMRINNLMERCD